MPPAPVKIERISADRTRQNTFHKRKLGLIKKAIELSVLCDCDVAIIMRSGPTITCPEGKMLAYCNGDLDTMVDQYMSEPRAEAYSNAEYARLSKADGHYAKPTEMLDAEAMSLPAIEVDVSTGIHEHSAERSAQPRSAKRIASVDGAGDEAAPQLGKRGRHVEAGADAMELKRQKLRPATAETGDEAGKEFEEGKTAGSSRLDTEERAAPELLQAGPMREMSWDLGGLLGTGACTSIDTLLSPFHQLNTPVAANAPAPFLLRA